jgi:hypothetical protein
MLRAAFALGLDRMAPGHVQLTAAAAAAAVADRVEFSAPVAVDTSAARLAERASAV